MKNKKIISVIGARPQFIKHAPVELELRKEFELITVHTGQHYDHKMSRIFFDELKINPPDYSLESGGYSHGKQTGMMLMELEEIILKEKPDAILVYGDTNSTLAGALAGSKLNLPVFHIEAGLRSYNKTMPEEVNRVLTDHVSSMFFIPSETARTNLNKEGIFDHIHSVGDVMYDMIKISIDHGFLKNEYGDAYYYVTLHRPYNVDEKPRLQYVLQSLNKLDKKLVFAIHPRTRHRMGTYGLNFTDYKNISFIDPVSYFENISLIANSDGLITDSGGMQKEAYWLKKRCITVRTETEWIETMQNAWNTLVFDDLDDLNSVFRNNPGPYIDGIYGDGNASEKIKEEIIKFFK